MPNDNRKTREAGPSQGKLRKALVTLSLVILGLIAFYLFGRFATTLLLIFAGVLLGIFLDGVAHLISTRLHWPRGLSLALLVALLLGSAFSFCWLAGPQVATQGRALVEQLPHSVELLRSRLQEHDWGRALLSSLPSFDELQLSISSVLGPVSQAFSITMELLGALIFVFFVGLYLAASPAVYRDGALLLLSREHRTRGREVLAALGKALRWWLLGRIVTMTLMGLLTTLALWWADLPLALVLGVIAGLLLFVPYLGAVVAAIPAILVGLMESPMKALWVAVIYTGIHVFEGYCITPFVQKRAVELPPALLLSVQVLSAALFGIMGIVFSTPLTVVAIVLVQMLYVQDVLDEDVTVLGADEPEASK